MCLPVDRHSVDRVASRDPLLVSGRATALERTALAGAGPAAPHLQTVLFPGVAVGQLFAVLLAIDPNHLVDVASYARPEMREPAGELALRRAPVAAIDGLELAPVDLDLVARQNTDPSAEVDERRSGAPDHRAVFAPEVRDRVVIWHKATGQPRQLHIPSGLTLQASAPRDAVQMAVDEGLEQDTGVMTGPTRPRRRSTFEPKPYEIEIVDEESEDPNRMILIDPVLQPLRKQRHLLSVDTLKEEAQTCLLAPFPQSVPRTGVFRQPRPKADLNGDRWVGRTRRCS